MCAGILRDWLIRGETANDVDTLVDDVQKKKEQIKTVLERHGLKCVEEKKKGAAHTLYFKFQEHTLEMDLVDPKTQPKTPPGVDCDVGNFAFDKGGLKMKVDNSKLVSLSKAIKHCQSKKFVFYRQLPDGPNDKEEGRLSKYISRGWTCKSPIPPDVVQRLNLPSNLLKPKKKYAKPWWTY
jgi:hypothetical protein